MYWRFKDSLIHPRRIPEHINNKFKNFLYFLILLVLFMFPNVLYLIQTGGIPNTEFGQIASSPFEGNGGFYIDDNILKNDASFDDTYQVLKNDGASVILTVKDVEKEPIILENIINSNKFKSNVVLVFDQTNIYGLLMINNKYTSFKFKSYEDLNIGSLDFKDFNNDVSVNNFAYLLKTLFNEYKTIIVGMMIPTLVISGVVSLLLILLIPTVIIALFYGKFGIKFGTIYKVSLYAFTPYIVLSLLSLGNPNGIFALAGQFISLIYIYIALSGIIGKNGGIKNEL